MKVVSIIDHGIAGIAILDFTNKIMLLKDMVWNMIQNIICENWLVNTFF